RRHWLAAIPAALWRIVFRRTWSLAQESHDGCRHQVGHGPCQHGAYPGFGQIVAALRSQGPDAADLNADGAEVCKAAKRKSGDGKGTRIERSLQRPELAESDKFVDDHAGAEQTSDGSRLMVMPGDADQPGYGGEYPAKDGL